MTRTLDPPNDLERPIVPTALLASIVDGFAVADTLWRPLVRHDPTERTAVRLLATDAYDVWLLGWWPGQHRGGGGREAAPPPTQWTGPPGAGPALGGRGWSTSGQARRGRPAESGRGGW